jgi:hypothetical protein
MVFKMSFGTFMALPHAYASELIQYALTLCWFVDCSWGFAFELQKRCLEGHGHGHGHGHGNVYTLLDIQIHR